MMQTPSRSHPGPVAGERTPTRALVAFSPGVLIGIFALGFLYVDSVGEHDLVRMLNGILWGQATGEQWRAGFHYGLSFSFGWYWLLYQLPPQVLGSLPDLIRTVNFLGVLGACSSVGFLGLLAWHLHGLSRGFAIALLFGFSPMMLELSTYGHPLTLSAGMLFAGTYLLFAGEQTGRFRRLLTIPLGALLLLFSLTVRAESLLAFPWILLLARDGENPLRQRRSLLIRAGALAGAAVVFFLLQAYFTESRPGESSHLTRFLAAAYSPGQVAKGAVALVITSGFATVAGVGVLAVVSLHRRRIDWALLPYLVLLVATLLFWLPNPLPARHFFYATLALASLFVLSSRIFTRPRATLLLAACAVVGNQVLAEVVYRPLIHRYDWSYASLTERRATFSLPLGWFLPNHRALQEMATHLRAEGRFLAKVPDEEVIVFGDALQYIILGIHERGGVVEWEFIEEAGFPVQVLRRQDQTYYLVSKYQYWPRDVTAEYLAVGLHEDATIFVQPSTSTHHDVLQPPPDRLIRLTPSGVSASHDR